MSKVLQMKNDSKVGQNQLMRQTRKRRGVRVSTSLDPETAELFEAWRQQHAIGKGSITHALRGLISIYLGVEKWPPNAPGFNSAWNKTPGWELKDPRSSGNSSVAYRLRLV